MNIEKLIILKLIESGARTRADFRRVVASVYRDNNTSGYHANIVLLAAYNEMLADGEIVADENVEKLLITKKMRSLSGVSVVTVLTKPFECPGKCIYCPTLDDVPKSYLPDEPAVMRAILNNYDAGMQVKTRLKSLAAQGHPIDKIELIVIGGTFSYLPRDYQEEFILGCFNAMNGTTSETLSEAKKTNEISKSRCVGLTLETRPDYITEDEVRWFRYLGATRVELGVQTVFDDVLKKNARGETVADTVRATKLLKDAGFKICYHLMPNLFGSNLERDEEMFRTVFQDYRFKPDYIKIYPCMVLENTPLHDLWKKGEYKSYTDDELIDLICRVKRTVPHWVRIMRTIRDIPAANIESGSTMSNMRQKIFEKAEHEGWSCGCIRCREARELVGDENTRIFTEEYEASDGKEYFLSFESEDRQIIYSLLRLRVPSLVIPEKAEIQEKIDGSQINFGMTQEGLEGAALIREVHTYGQQVEVGEKGETQHLGYGRKLIEEAEKIAAHEGFSKVAVISGVGVRSYYKKFGYVLQGEYMVKSLIQG